MLDHRSRYVDWMDIQIGTTLIGVAGALVGVLATHLLGTFDRKKYLESAKTATELLQILPAGHSAIPGVERRRDELLAAWVPKRSAFAGVLLPVIAGVALIAMSALAVAMIGETGDGADSTIANIWGLSSGATVVFIGAAAAGLAQAFAMLSRQNSARRSDGVPPAKISRRNS